MKKHPFAFLHITLMKRNKDPYRHFIKFYQNKQIRCFKVENLEDAKQAKKRFRADNNAYWYEMQDRLSGKSLQNYRI